MSAYTIITNADLRHKSIAVREALLGRNGFWSGVGNFHVDNCVKISRQGGPQAMDLTINSPPFIWLAAANGKCSCSCTHQLLTTKQRLVMITKFNKLLKNLPKKMSGTPCSNHEHAFPSLFSLNALTIKMQKKVQLQWVQGLPCMNLGGGNPPLSPSR